MDLPYSDEVMPVLLPPRFKVPQIDMYNGYRDPVDHLENFKAYMTLHDFSGKVACRALPLTLKGIALGWFKTLRPGTINRFEELANLAAYLLTIKQKEGESLKAYLSKFNKERLTTDDQDEKITLAALLGGIWPRSPFITELVRKTPSTLREFMDRADDYVNAEDMLQALLEPRKQEMKHDSKSSNKDRKASSNNNGRGRERHFAQRE
ncbi:uncharacterized protein LOC122278527 [Carya illinoinensis]|uniref:uncharacterized protein LOC122278527 n=1 Tax=Carya illinoinensis TaxID=32201 RepID=UPI001C718EEF|nr:uncharacterized protein LOC122278527 [Carya illinoinensis]